MRLLKPAEFQRVFRGRTAHSSDNYLTLLAIENEQDGPRLGLAIAKKHIRLAVGRNRIKRQARESFRLHRNALPAFDAIVMAKPAAARASTEDLRNSLERHWRRLSKRLEKSSSQSSKE